MTDTFMKTKKQWHILIVILSAVLVTALVTAIFLDQLIVLFTPVKDEVVLEAGSSAFSVDLFSENDRTEITLLTDPSTIDLNKVGNYTLNVMVGKRSCNVTLRIVDTTPPTAESTAKQIYTYETVTAKDMVTNISDISPVKVEFAKEPTFGTVGTQKVLVNITDEAGNKTTVTSELTVIKDSVAPVFSEMSDLVIRLGDAISYKKGVNVTDNRDENVAFSVDSSAVNTTKVGTYSVTYTATDSDGNTTTATRKVVIQNKVVIDQELVEKMAKDVLDKIITDGMTDHQKIDAIFKYVKKNMVYVSSPETDIPNAAYVAFTNKRGDCYNYFSMTKLLLDGCGIQNMKIERMGGSTTHFWLLVNIGSGWYHYDTTPQHHLYPFSCFMKTDAEVWAYAASRGDGRSDYYNFDKSLYPDRATEKYSG